jgi:hypothetical protein
MNKPASQCEWREKSKGSKRVVRNEGLLGLVAVIGGLHLAALSFALGPRCIAYVVVAYLSAVVVWGSLLMGLGRRRLGFIVGIGLSVAFQQAAYQVWKGELGGFWWPLAQFGALHVMIAVGISQLAKMAT